MRDLELKAIGARGLSLLGNDLHQHGGGELWRAENHALFRCKLDGDASFLYIIVKSLQK